MPNGEIESLLNDALVLSRVTCLIDRIVTLDGVEYRLDVAHINPLLNVWSRSTASEMRATVGDPLKVLRLNSAALASAVERIARETR